MFSSKCNYPKLKTNLRLTVNRLKLLEKKKTELALKSRREIADYIQAGKEDRARIRVEHIVREDYMVEGMEILEMFCDLLLARFGIIERVSAIDPTIEEAVASIIWAEPRLSADVPELGIISKNLLARYGKEYHAASKSNTLNTVNEKLIRKMSIYSPPKMLIENYMVEIAKSFDVDFTPDPLALLGEDGGLPMGDLIGIGVGEFGVSGGPPPPPTQPPSGGGGYPPPSGGGGYPPPSGGGGYPPPSGGGGYPPPNGGGGGGFSYPPSEKAANFHPPAGGVNVLPSVPSDHTMYPPPVPSVPPAGPVLPSPPGAQSQLPPGGFNIPPDGGYPNFPPAGGNNMNAPGGQPRPPVYSQNPGVEHPPNYSSLNIRNNLSDEPGRPSAPDGDIPSLPAIPDGEFNLPSVPGSVNPGEGQPPGAPDASNDIDFDDLAARFEKLKNRK